MSLSSIVVHQTYASALHHSPAHFHKLALFPFLLFALCAPLRGYKVFRTAYSNGIYVRPHRPHNHNNN